MVHVTIASGTAMIFAFELLLLLQSAWFRDFLGSPSPSLLLLLLMHILIGWQGEDDSLLCLGNEISCRVRRSCVDTLDNAGELLSVLRLGSCDAVVAAYHLLVIVFGIFASQHLLMVWSTANHHHLYPLTRSVVVWLTDYKVLAARIESG